MSIAEALAAERRARGAYYTPPWLAARVVRHALGPLLAAAPATRAPRLRILDPACGEGAFLVAALEHLIQGRNRRRRAEGKPRLTLAAKAALLIKAIYGVDVDAQALEAARKNLLAAIFYGERDDAIDRWIRGRGMACWRALSANLKCGDALVDRAVAGAAPFSWPTAFPAARRAGGFDCVVGNPPFLNAVEKRTRPSAKLIAYYKDRYRSSRGAFDRSVLFQELGLELLKEGGRAAFVVPNKTLAAPYAAAFRAYALAAGELRWLGDFSAARAFGRAAVYPVAYVIEKAAAPRASYPVRWERVDADGKTTGKGTSRLARAAAGNWGELFSAGAPLLARLRRDYPKLGDVVDVRAGATAAEAYRLRPFVCEGPPAAGGFPLITSGAVAPFRLRPSVKPIRYLGRDYTAPCIPKECAALSDARRRQYAGAKIILPGIARRLEAAYDPGGAAAAVGTFQLLPHGQENTFPLELLLALLNSRLYTWVWRQGAAALALAGGYARVAAADLQNLPLPANPDINVCRRLAALAAAIRDGSAPADWQARLDRAVVALFRLSPADRRLVHRETAPYFPK